MAQIPAAAADTVSRPEAADSIFMPAERSILLLWDRTHLLLEDGRYAEAVRCLDGILGGKEDYFFKPDRDVSVHRSLKSEARRLLGNMPARGRQAYELQFGALSRQRLSEAVESGRIELVAETARRYFHTEAGYESTYLLGVHHLNHGRPLVAALTFRRLREEGADADRFEPSLSLAMAGCWLKAGMPEAARDALDALRARYPMESVRIEGRDVPLFPRQEDSVEWLRSVLGEPEVAVADDPLDWAVHRGTPHRNARVSGGRPLLNVRWRVPTTDNPDVEKLIDRLQQQQEEREIPLLPGLHPLIIDDVVLMRTATNLLAVDFVSGKRLWEVPADDPFEAAMNPLSDVGRAHPGGLDTRLRLRLWGDIAYGTLASDGQLVFAVEDLQLPTSSIYSRVLIAPGQPTSSHGSLTPYNRLAAYEIRSEGMLRWQLGGAPSKNGNLPLAGAFFLGPPLPLLGDLYAIVEIEGEIRLVAIDAARGTVLWQQQLGVVEESVLHDTLRRVSGVSPSYADGVLVCPTSNHSIVAIELTTRSLLWGYSYAEQELQNQRLPNLFGTIRRRNPNPEDRWADSTLVVADGRIFATPNDSDRLHCLSLHDGELLWQAPREDQMLVAGIRDGKVIILGRRGLSALRVEDGGSAWNDGPTLCPEGSAPSGSGFFDETHYYLPLTGGKLMAVDIATGNVAHTWRSRHGHTLGNLVCHKGKVLSQRADRVESFYELESLRSDVSRRLSVNPDDAGGLALLGEILWDEGRRDDAAELLRRSLAAAESMHARDLLRTVLLEGLEADFAGYHDQHAEITALIDSAEDRAAFHRLMALGWERMGRYADALTHYRQLVDLDRRGAMFIPAEEDHLLRQDRWLRVRLRDLHEEAPPEVRGVLGEWVNSELKAALAGSGPDAIAEVLPYFMALPGAATTRFEQIERLIQAGRYLEAEMALMAQSRSENPESAGAAVARWAAMLAEAGRAADAAALLLQLDTQFASTPVSGSQTGSQFARALEQENEKINRARMPVRWPEGWVEHTVSEPQSQALPSYGRWSIPSQRSRFPFLHEIAVELHQQPMRLIARDSLGKQRWELALEPLVNLNQLALGRSLMRIDACGHLMILSLGSQIVAIDTLAADEKSPPRVVWKEPVDPIDAETLRQQLSLSQMHGAPGWLGAPRFGGLAGYSFGTAVVLSNDLICLKRSRACAALDPVDGKELWRRENVSSQSTVLGDEEVVLIVPPQATRATVLAAFDGKELGTCAVPPEDQRMAIFGRRILTWEGKGRGYRLKLLDPWVGGEEQPVWGPFDFEIDAKIQMLDHEAVAVYSPDGRFTIFRLDDGEKVVDEQLQEEQSLTDIVVLRVAGQYVLVANNAVGRENTRRRVNQVAGAIGRKIGQAKVYGFSPEGERLWQDPLVVIDQYLPLMQPAGVPCLTFACMVQDYAPSQQSQPKIEVVSIDIRTGTRIFDGEFEGPSHTFDIEGDPEASTVAISLQQQILTLRFTDQPPPPREQTNSTATKPRANVVDAVWRAVLQGAMIPPATGGEPNFKPRASGKLPAAPQWTPEIVPLQGPATAPPALEPAIREHIPKESPAPVER